jgi:hypothetical protein
MAPPEWALLQRELLKANEEACAAFFARYFDDRGYLLAVERWGANDGPDDAIENVNDWPTLHALGAGDQPAGHGQEGLRGQCPPVHGRQDHRRAVRPRRHVLQANSRS